MLSAAGFVIGGFTFADMPLNSHAKCNAGIDRSCTGKRNMISSDSDERIEMSRLSRNRDICLSDRPDHGAERLDGRPGVAPQYVAEGWL